MDGSTMSTAHKTARAGPFCEDLRIRHGHGVGPNDGDGAKDARAATIQPNEQSTIDPTQMRPAWRSPL